MGTAAAVFETTTAAIVTQIANGAGEWRMPWSTVGVEFPVNPTTKKRYPGGNVLTLIATALDAGCGSGEWQNVLAGRASVNHRFCHRYRSNDARRTPAPKPLP